ncbi:MAG: MFS transporter [Lachnospiraceae bacterium]|nr:MFS transporter [Lachnospiraceae bacterium]
MTIIYSFSHFLVDGICALAMFGKFIPRENGYFLILIYNFCAFALQMPLGVILDFLIEKDRLAKINFSFLSAMLGIIITFAGVFTHPAILGIGNALFHAGGGVETILEDRFENRQGKKLGIFVAPGALGLYLGTLLAKGGMWKEALLGAGVLSVLIVIWVCMHQRLNPPIHTILKKYDIDSDGQNRKNAFSFGTTVSIFCCMTVVILRSCLGMATAFPWKSGALAGLLAVLSIVTGKIAGGFASARYGFQRTVTISLGLAACCYLFSDLMPAGLAALFLFNMTMPITLYWLACCLPKMPGFAFGFLTFALFLGFLPGYFGLLPQTGGNLVGCAGSVISLLLLTIMRQKL